MRPKLTIGMAVYDDYDGVYFTIQSLRLYHDLTDVELIVVDNKPDSGSSNQLRLNMEGYFHNKNAGCRYIAAPEITGTSAPRDRVFEEARGDAVMCIDSHVMLFPGAVRRLIDYYDAHTEQDLLTGPLIYDSLNTMATHFNPFWRREMWGIWGQAWEVCPGEHISVIENELTKEAVFVSLDMDMVPLTASQKCGMKFPAIPYAGHERILLGMGIKPLGGNDGDVFEIPGQGLGLFTCRKDAWLGFNQHFRGFGGEELYIHEKFRQAGRKCLCLGFLKWLHRFHRARGVAYRLSRWDKIRNYVLGHQEIGRPLDAVYDHFVNTSLMSKEEWEALIADPLRPLPPKQTKAVVSEAATVDAIFEQLTAKPRDLDKHMRRLRALANECPRIAEFSHRRESLVALLAGLNKGGSFESHNTEAQDKVAVNVLGIMSDGFEDIWVDGRTSDQVPSIKPCDLLFIDSVHTAARLSDEFMKFVPQVSRYIALHDTMLHGNKGEDGGPGLMGPIRDLCENHGWFIAHHTHEQHGFTVLGKLESDRPEERILLWPLGHGPGTELSALLEGLGIVPAPSCDCKAKAQKMDAWGVEGCLAHREEIIGWMRDGQERWGWKERLKAAAKAVTSGLAFQLNPLDPFPGIIDECIRRADEKESDAT